MPLTSKLRADYIELINQQLDTIKIDSLDDFLLIQRALENIIQPSEDYVSPEKFRDKIFFIKDILQSPEDYVEHESNYNEYKQLIRERVSAKITELQSLSEVEKQVYIQNQQEQRAQSIRTQQVIAEHRPPEPGSAAHVLTEEQWLAELQANEASTITLGLDHLSTTQLAQAMGAIPHSVTTLTLNVTGLTNLLYRLTSDQLAQILASVPDSVTILNLSDDDSPQEPNPFAP